MIYTYRQREKTKQTDGSPVALFNMFVQRVRDQLHVVLAMSPIGEAFRNRLRKFPSLVNCCTIDWFQVSNILPLFALILNLGPVVQSIISLTSSLRGQLVKYLQLYNQTQRNFLLKNERSFYNAKASPIFSTKSISLH